jgi:hypothetical protein
MAIEMSTKPAEEDKKPGKSQTAAEDDEPVVRFSPEEEAVRAPHPAPPITHPLTVPRNS